MHKKIITIVSFLLTVVLCACELPVPMREVDVTPVSFEELTYTEAVPDFAAEPVKQYAVAPSTADNSLIYDETNIALLNLYEEQTEIELQKQAEAKKKKETKKNNNSNNNNGSNNSSQGSGYSYTQPDYEPEPEPEAEPYTPPSVSGYADQVVALVNAERASAGLGSVSATSALNQAAQKRAEEIVSSFAHSRPDGRSCFTVLEEYGISYMAAGENIAAGQWSPESVMYSWMNSPGHRANILSPDFGHIGVGVVYIEGSTYGYYWVQLFTD